MRRSSDSRVSKLSLEKETFSDSRSAVLSRLDLTLFPMSRFAVGKWTPLHAVSVSGVRGRALEYKGAFYWKCIKWDQVFRTVSHEGQFNLMAGCTGLRGRRLGSLLTSCVVFRNVREAPGPVCPVGCCGDEMIQHSARHIASTQCSWHPLPCFKHG